ncbi:Hemolysin secretion protein D, chromosomal [invertebrate metagenome]|uniref:Hemolysin secretion protein D, chromosomal n=1 Tax=invertebrate metagenome TaxID=1711999 RepID=A0A2H9T9H7_9ZZZZ
MKKFYRHIIDAQVNALHPEFSVARFILFLIIGMSLLLIIIIALTNIDEITVGEGKIIPSTTIQIIQSLDGGAIKNICIHEGDTVKSGTVLLQIEDTRSQSLFRSKHREIEGLTAEIVRLETEIHSINISSKKHPIEVKITPQEILWPTSFHNTHHLQIIRNQSETYHGHMQQLQHQITSMQQQIDQKKLELIDIQEKKKFSLTSMKYLEKEINIKSPLVNEGIFPSLDLLQLQRRLSDHKSDINSMELTVSRLLSVLDEQHSKKIMLAQSFLNETWNNLCIIKERQAQLKEEITAVADRVNKTQIRAPVTGTVKKLHFTTIGAVIMPGENLLEMVPQDDSLLIEAKISPSDIAFLHTDQPANIRLSAYDYTRYGAIKGFIEYISADTIEDNRNNIYYIIRVRTTQQIPVSPSHFKISKIIPGMRATVEIITGQRTILSYLTQPVLLSLHNSMGEK